ncbi:hypothetical protein ACS0PU_012972 [Formica fusca]
MRIGAKRCLVEKNHEKISFFEIYNRICLETQVFDLQNRYDLQSRAAERLHLCRIVKSDDLQSCRDATVESHVASIPVLSLSPSLSLSFSLFLSLYPSFTTKE